MSAIIHIKIAIISLYYVTHLLRIIIMYIFSFFFLFCFIKILFSDRTKYSTYKSEKKQVKEENMLSSASITEGSGPQSNGIHQQSEVKKAIHNLFAPDLPSSCQIATDLRQQYENYTNINKNVNAILNRVCFNFSSII